MSFSTEKGFQSPCAGNMFGKVLCWIRSCVTMVRTCFNPRVRGTCLVRSSQQQHRSVGEGSSSFQSPCAGNMFGKAYWRTAGMEWSVAFQSPCAGNMFGKRDGVVRSSAQARHQGFNPRVRGTCLVRAGQPEWPSYRALIKKFQSPCAGNMFGKLIL